MAYIHKLKKIIGRILYTSVDFFVYHDSKFAEVLTSSYGIVIKTFRQLKVRLFPVEWLDEKKEQVRAILDPEETYYSYGLKHIDGTQRVVQVTLPAINLYHFENARISVLSSSILLDNKIIIERVEGLDVRRCNYSSGHVFMHGQKSALVRDLQTEHLEQGIFLGGNGSSNYYHWMIEILPKLKYLKKLEEYGYDGFPLLVSEDVDHIKTFREALNYVVKDKPVVMLNKDKAYCVRNLVYVNAPNNLPFNLRRREKMMVSDFLMRPSSINFLQNCLNSIVGLPSPEKGSPRLFFSRRNERRNYNEQEIFEIFKQYGFQKVFMEELSLKEQITLMSNAEVIAGPTGAAWTNLIFCGKGLKCLCWMADGYGDFSAFSNLAMIVGADMRYITFKTDAKSIAELYDSNYHIEAKRIRQGLETLLGPAT